MSNRYSYNNYVISRLHPGEKEDEKDVVIIGAGIAGLTVAIVLARAGKSVTLII
jgi:NADPH-dependent 2,4-dienoyl-CoA reductase/sulfur reductase-like enzyme